MGKQYDDIRSMLDTLQADVADLHDALSAMLPEAGSIPSEAELKSVEAAIAAYRQRSAAFMETGADLFADMPATFAEAREAISRAERLADAESVRADLEAFFRIAGSSDLEDDLNAAKAKVREICAFDDEAFAEAFAPYRALLGGIRGEEDELSDEQYDLIDAQIGRRIARAVDRGKLSIDEAQPVDAWFDGSCPRLTREGAAGEAQPVEEDVAVEMPEAQTVEESVAEEKPEAQPTEEAAAEAIPQEQVSEEAVPVVMPAEEPSPTTSKKSKQKKEKPAEKPKPKPEDYMAFMEQMRSEQKEAPRYGGIPNKEMLWAEKKLKPEEERKAQFVKRLPEEEKNAPKAKMEEDIKPAAESPAPVDAKAEGIPEADVIVERAEESIPEASATVVSDTENTEEVIPETTVTADPVEEKADKAIQDTRVTTDEKTSDKVEQYLDGAWRMVTLGRIDAASVMLKSLSLYDESIASLSDQFALATGDPSRRESRGPAALQAVFSKPFGDDLAYDALAAAAYLRMYFSTSVMEQTYLVNDVKFLQENLIYKRCQPLADSFYRLSSFVKYQNRGLDKELIDRALDRKSSTDQLKSIKQRAQNYLDAKLTETTHYYAVIKRMRELLYGNGSDLRSIFEAIVKDDRSLLPVAQAWANKDIDKTIDEMWTRAVRELRKSLSDVCTGVERTTQRRQIGDIQSLLRDWLTLSATETGITSDQINYAEKLMERLRTYLPVLQETLRGDIETGSLRQQAALKVLSVAAGECLDRIDGRSDELMQAWSYYIELLRAPYVALDSIYQPHIDWPEEEVSPFDFCRRAMEYADAPDLSWEEVLDLAFDPYAKKREYTNLGCMRVLEDYLQQIDSTDLWRPDYDLDKQIKRLTRTSKESFTVDTWRREFEARIDMADGDGWFEADPSMRAHINRVMEFARESYCAQDNFGFYASTMDRLLDLLKQKAETLQDRYQREYDALLTGIGEEDAEKPIFAQIRGMIKEHRFGAAHSYMQLVRSGNFSVEEGTLSSESVMQDFLEKLDENLFNDAKVGRTNNLSDIFQRRNGQKKNNTITTGIRMLDNWPGGNLSPIKIKNFLTEMDLSISDIKAEREQLTISFPSPEGIVDYPHPMAAFGSNMLSRGLDVACVAGNKDADALTNDIMQKLNLPHGERPLLLFFDSAIAKDERRKLARKLKNLSSSTPILILDRCLALYLAGKQKSERWKALLRCALPFRVINPYFEDSKLPIPPDMFIGRREEIRKIIDPNGPNLLYGGRQLGKSAILRRAEYQQNRPDEGYWSVYVDIKGMDGQDAVDEIAKALMRKGFWTSEERPDNWKRLLDKIEDSLTVGEDAGKRHLLLLMDEADTLLSRIEADGANLLDRLKRVQTNTDGRFKFVMAGLHNVLRFDQKSLAANSVLPHLGGITIEPMRFSDGRELLEAPLSYLGFTIDSAEKDIIAQILYDTNYFPGLIHFYASRLVQSVVESAPVTSAPPYRLTRDVLLRLLGDEEFRHLRKERLMMTLTVDADDEDSYYYTLANAVACCCYEDEVRQVLGVTADEVRKVCADLEENSRIAQLNSAQIVALLDELTKLHILTCEDMDHDRRYRFSRTSFLEMLGDEERVQDNLLSALMNSADGQ